MPAGVRLGGRKKGVPNKATADIKAYAQKHGKAAIEGILKLARRAKSEQVRLNAWTELMNRAYGKPAQSVDLSNTDGSLAGMWSRAVQSVNQEAEAPTGAGTHPTH